MTENLSESIETSKELLRQLSTDTTSIVSDEYIVNQKIVKCTGKFFSEMALQEKIKKGLTLKKLDKASKIQEAAIPIIMEGTDCAIQSESGSGKTLAYTLGILGKIQRGRSGSCLVLSPVKELSLQICEEIKEIANLVDINVEAVIKKRDAKCKAEIIVGSPGTIFGLISEGRIKNVDFIVLDEADITLDIKGMGVLTVQIIKKHKNAQLLFFSATYNQDIKDLIKLHAKENLIDCYESNKKPEGIKIFTMSVPHKEKLSVLMQLYGYLAISQSIVFCSTKAMVDKLKETFEKDAFTCSFLHGEMEDNMRFEAYVNFRKGISKVMICTDVFSRGMDIAGVNLIVNYDLPFHDNKFQTYVHRIGRSGRFGRAGFVIDFVSSENDLKESMSFAQQLGYEIRNITLESLEQAYKEI